jgi:ABC-type multidrug transport system permease subunit
MKLTTAQKVLIVVIICSSIIGVCIMVNEMIHSFCMLDLVLCVLNVSVTLFLLIELLKKRA